MLYDKTSKSNKLTEETLFLTSLRNINGVCILMCYINNFMSFYVHSNLVGLSTSQTQK